jgi:hypothetical protein
VDDLLAVRGEREHLVAAPAELDGDVGSGFEEVDRLEAPAVPVMLREKVDDLSAVVSGRCGAFEPPTSRSGGARSIP